MKNLICCFVFLGIFNGNLFSQINWEHTSGPFGSLLSYIYSNDKYAFIPENDFLYRTDDGMQWEKLKLEGSSTLAIYKDTILNPSYDKSLARLRLQISTDNGESWVVKNLPSLIRNYADIALCRHGIYWAQTSKNLLFKSTDLGETWDTIFHPINYGYDLAIFDERLYAYSLGRIWRTDQNGENWEEVITPVQSLQHVYIDDFIVKDSNWVISTEDYIFYSHDDGKTWNQFPVYSSNTFDKLELVGNDVYFQFFGNLLRTSDFGVHWDTLSTDVNILSFITLAGLRDIFLGATYNKGVFRWDESTRSVIESNDGLSKGCIYALSYGAEKIWTACGNGVFAYDIPKETWSDKMNLPLPSFEYSSVSANDDGWVVALPIYGDSLYISEDQGQNWDTIHTDFYIDRVQFLGNHLFAFYDYGVFRSLDQGKHWDTLHLAASDDNIVLFKGKNYLLGYDNIYFTADDGIIWNTLTNPIDIIKLYSDGDHLYGMTVDTFGYIDLFISNDAVNWTYAGKNLPDIYYQDFIDIQKAFFFRDNTHYFAFLGDYGHYISPIDSIEWSPLETTQTGSDYLIHDNVVYLGSEGMYKSAIVDPFITGTKDPISTSNNLFIISPNPVNENLQIKFNSGCIAKGVIQIYTPDGILVKSVKINESNSHINIPVRDLSGGMYYVVFNGEGVSDVRLFVKLD